MSEQLIPTPGTFGDNGNFLLERELGAGGMGGVYMGRDKMLDRPVAVKVMLKEYGADAEFVEKFKKEAQAAAKLIHPNIAQIYSYGICDGMPYIAMELASGGSLYSVMTANPGHADITRVLKICQQTALALQCASDQGFVHGDVKPENILLDANGNAKLVDFGLAAMQKDTDEIWGTPYYISPEKVRKEVVDFRADMYSLGGTLYHALTGIAPFEGEDSIAVVKKRFDGAPKKPSEIRPEITPAVDTLVMKMLALNKEDRYPSFEALLEAFKDVLTTGLTQKLADDSGKVAPKAPAGARRMVVRGRRMMTAKRPGTTIKRKLEGEEGNEGAADEEVPKPETADDDDENEGGGNLGLKVALFVIGGLLLIGGVIGGLVWFKVASEASEKAAIAAQIQGGFDKASEAVKDTVKKAVEFADEFDVFARKAIDECQKPTDQLMKILPPEHAKLLKPATSKELEAAIAATNDTPPVAAAPAPAPVPAATNATATATNAVAKAATTNAPAAKADAAKKDAKPEGKKDAKPAPAPEPEKAEPPPQVVVTMNELWERAYSCQASAIRIRHQTRQLVAKAAEADGLKEVSRENMDKLAELSRTLVELLDQIKMSKDVENVKKGITYIKSKGEKTVEQTVKRLRIEKLEAERKAKAEAAAEAEKERLAKQEEEKKAKVKEETDAIDAVFETIASQGSFRQLDWKGAIRQLETAKIDLETPEGQLRADLQVRKVNDMKKMQEVFVKSLKGHAFRGKLKGTSVTDVNDKDISIGRADGKGSSKKITWQKFVKEYPGNLNEIINTFVVNGRRNAKPALNLKDWADAMTGAALMMQLVCSEVNGAVERAEALAKETVKQFPEYVETARAIFPEIKFEVSEE